MSRFHGFIGFIVNGFIVSWVFVVCMVSWFHRFWWFQWLHSFLGFVVSRFHGFIGFVVVMVSWFHRFRDVYGFMVS